MRIGMFWIPPGEFRISKTPLSILLVPEFAIRLPLRVSRSLTVLVSPAGTFTTPGGGKPDPAHRLRRRSVTQTGARE